MRKQKDAGQWPTQCIIFLTFTYIKTYFHVSEKNRCKKVTYVSHIPACFRPVPQSCTHVHSIVTRRNHSQDMRPYRQHLLLNKLLVDLHKVYLLIRDIF